MNRNQKWCTYLNVVLTTRIDEHRKKNTPVGRHIRHSGNDSGESEFSWKINDQAPSSIKLLKRGAAHYEERPVSNTRDEFRRMELTRRLKFQNRKISAKTKSITSLAKTEHQILEFISDEIEQPNNKFAKKFSDYFRD